MDEFSIDPTPDGPDEEANEAKLNAMLANYQRALEQEWETNEAYREGKLNPLEIREKTKELLTGAVPKAVAVMLHLAQHAKQEGVRLKAAQYIIDKAVGKELSQLVGDPLEALLGSINGQAPAATDSE